MVQLVTSGRLKGYGVMYIRLKYPFNRYFRKGKLLVNRERRRTVILINYGSRVTSISYARYKMSVKHKRFLKPHEHVDHINNDKTDDRYSNLQIVTEEYNRIKYAIEVSNGTKNYRLECPVCGTLFERAANQVDYKETATCSRRCGRIIGSITGINRKIILDTFRTTIKDYPELGYRNTDLEIDEDYIPDLVIRTLPDKDVLIYNAHKIKDTLYKNKCVVCLGYVENENFLYCSDKCHQEDPLRNKVPTNLLTNNCKQCNKLISTKLQYCSQVCFKLKNRKVVRPTKEKLEKLTKTMSLSEIGRIHEVAGNTVKKWCKGYGIDYRRK